MKELTILLAASMLIACGGETSGPDTVQGRPDSTISALERINRDILSSPNEPTGYYQRALHRIQDDSLNSALADMQRAILLDSTQAVYYETAGDIHYRKTRVKEAMDAFDKCIALDPENLECKFRKAEILLVLRRYKETLELTNMALRADPNQAKGYYIKGWVHKERGDSSLAISSFHTAVEQDPDYYDAWVQLGMLYAAQGNPLALDFYNSAISIKQYSTESWYNKGMFAQQIGMDSLALECYAEIMQFDPANPTAHFNSGWVELEMIGNNTAAVAHFTKAIELKPDYYQAYYNRGLAHERNKDLGHAEEDYRKALDIEPDFDVPALGLTRLGVVGR